MSRAASHFASRARAGESAIFSLPKPWYPISCEPDDAITRTHRLGAAFAQIYGRGSAPSRRRRNLYFVVMEPPSLTPSSPVRDMSAAEFRKHGYAVIDWIAQYLDAPER